MALSDEAVRSTAIARNARSFERELLIAKLEAEMLATDPGNSEIEWRKGWNTRALSLIEALREPPVHERFDTTESDGSK